MTVLKLSTKTFSFPRCEIHCPKTKHDIKMFKDTAPQPWMFSFLAIWLWIATQIALSSKLFRSLLPILNDLRIKYWNIVLLLYVEMISWNILSPFLFLFLSFLSYIYIYIYIYIYKYINIYIYTHARTHTRTHAHTHARTHARTHAMYPYFKTKKKCNHIYFAMKHHL